MNLEPWARAGLLFLHLGLCMAALMAVLQADLRVLRRRVGPRTLGRTHRTVAWLLAGLWLSGLAIVHVDVGLNPALVAGQPKIMVKLVCVLTLTLNGLVLHAYALPRISAQRPLLLGERLALAVMGAVSTASWLLAAFIGVARPLATWPVAQAIGAYFLLLALACAVALVVVPQRLQRRSLRSNETALEAAGRETLRVELPQRG